MAARAKMAKAAQSEEINIPKMEYRITDIPIIGETPLISNRWNPEQIEKIKAKQEKRNLPEQGPRKPQAEFEATIYRLPHGAPAFPAAAFKRASVEAVRLVSGMAMTEARVLFHFLGDENTDLVRIIGNPTYREDMRKLESGTYDPVYRAEYKEWGAVLRVKLLINKISIEQMVNLVNLAGIGGVGAWRASSPTGKSGNFGMFHVASEKEMAKLIASLKKKSSRG